MPKSTRLKDGYGPYTYWELSEVVSLSQPDASHSSLKLIREKHTVLEKESNDYISKNIKQTMIVKSSYTACFSQTFLFEFQFLISVID